jgi:hypothetical protein
VAQGFAQTGEPSGLETLLDWFSLRRFERTVNINRNSLQRGGLGASRRQQQEHQP